MTGKSEALINALEKVDPGLASLYQSAIQLLESTEIADRVCIVSYIIREILSEFPKYYDVPIKNNKKMLSDHVSDLKRNWRDLNIESYLKITDESVDWNGSERSEIRIFLTSCGILFDKHKEMDDSRRDKAITMIRSFTSKHNLEDISQHQIDSLGKDYMDYQEYFNGVLHSPLNRREDPIFLAKLSEFEDFFMDLIGLIEPDVIGNNVELAKLIQEGEQNAN